MKKSIGVCLALSLGLFSATAALAGNVHHRHYHSRSVLRPIVVYAPAPVYYAPLPVYYSPPPVYISSFGKVKVTHGRYSRNRYRR